ncbi:hypothetical protein Tco_1541026 [Tanacetum coccineum]
MLQSPPVRRALSSRLKLRHLRKVSAQKHTAKNVTDQSNSITNQLNSVSGFVPIRNLISKSLDSDDVEFGYKDFLDECGLSDKKAIQVNRMEKQEYVVLLKLNGSSPSFMKSKPQKFRIGGSSDMNNRLISKDVVNDFGKIKVEDGTLDDSSGEYLKIMSILGFSKIYNLLDDVLPKDLDYLYNLDANVKSLLESSDTSDAGGQTLNSSHGSIRSRSTSKKRQTFLVGESDSPSVNYQMGLNDNLEKENPHPQNFRVFLMIRTYLFVFSFYTPGAAEAKPRFDKMSKLEDHKEATHFYGTTINSAKRCLRVISDYLALNLD